MSDNIKVVVKVRPLISREIEDKLSYQWRVKNDTLYQLDQYGRDGGSCFTFDKVYDEETKTSDIYNDIAKPIVKAAIAGFNGTIFAYGQTSSGKTYTMTGTEESPGIIPLAVFNLFEIIKNIPDRDFLVRVSYIEIYNETLKDLLNVEKKNIKVHENFQGVKVDCTEQVTTSPDEVLKYLKEGEANRQTGATNMNEESSRSHSIFQITIESRDHIEGEEEVGCVNVSTLNLVDLAGSERAGQTGATGIRFKEGTHINKSLSALALVIKQLSEDQTKHVNYRDSKLTRILQNSLGGNAKTSIICAITPAAVEETISTLQFANRAKAIKNKPEVNAVATDATMIQSLTKQLSKLQSQLESKKNLEVMLESKKNVEFNLQKQIAALQRLILNGFGQTSSVDLVTGARRKLLPSRRITISTLHPIQEDPVPPVRKFHTPLLKYNPMLIPGAKDFVPIQNANKLASLPEEQDRLVTPPPPDRKVNFNDEIIELDSDDDNSSLDVQTCSPYHKCYVSSKTPPCILRKNAKLAEKNLQDIVELTEREKIYTPNVVELIEKLEQNTNVIAKLEDEVISLNKRSKEKDLEIDQLRVKVTKSQEDVKSVNCTKAELETICKEYATKLTDWEVSYETLQNKTRRREEELLSLLEEQKMLRKAEDTGKSLLRNLEKEINFMDMSKDISLVNSDNESSITNVNDDDTTSQVQDLVTDMQNQLASKNQAILALESDLLSQKQKIISLENSSQELQQAIENFKEKFTFLENENSLLKSTVDTLNSTIKSQKANLESANNDIESYNSLIQELQIKLTNKEKILNVNINESILENMVANEEKFIANNDNMKNIIHSFKKALDSRNKEIESLKIQVQDTSQSTENSSLKEQLSLRENEIHALNEKATSLQNQITKNISLIDKLIQEKNNLTDLEQQLTNKLASIMKQNEQLESINEKNKVQITELKDSYESLFISGAEKEKIEKELTLKCMDLNKNIKSLDTKIYELEKEISTKHDIITNLEKKKIQSNESLSKAQSTLHILQNIILKFSGDIQELPSNFESVLQVFTVFEENLGILDSKMTEIINKKDLDIESCLILKSDLEKSNNELTFKLSEVESKTNIFNNVERDLNETKNNMQKQITELMNERDEIRKNLNKNIKSLDAKIYELEKEINAKDDIITNLEKEKIQSVESLSKAQSTLHILQNIILKFSVDIQELPSNFESVLQVFTVFEEKLVILDSKMSEIINKKDLDIESCLTLKSDLEKSNNELTLKLSELESKTDIFNNVEMDLNKFKNNMQKQITELINERDEILKQIDLKTKENHALATQVTELERLYESFKSEVLNKDNEIASLQEKEASLCSEIKTLMQDKEFKLQEFMLQINNVTTNLDAKELMLSEKEQEIHNLKTLLEKTEESLKEKSIKFENLAQKLNENINNESTLLLNVLNHVTNLVTSFDIVENHNEVNNISTYDRILYLLNNVQSFVASVNEKRIEETGNIEHILKDAENEIQVLTQRNEQLIENMSQMENKKYSLISELNDIKLENKRLNENLEEDSKTLELIRKELKEKSNDITDMVSKTQELKDHFTGLDLITKEQLGQLTIENEKLQNRCSELVNVTSRRTSMDSLKLDDPVENSDNNNGLEKQSPQSLLTICCNKIVDYIQPSEKSVTTTNSNVSFECSNKETQITGCKCQQLLKDLNDTQSENYCLSKIIEELEISNQNLLKEQTEVRRELKLLVEPAFELQKKINTHKTNLSTLTATTYAENKSLKSQVKVLQHHHSRFHNVCQKDIPVVKKQLYELLAILKNDSSYFDKHNASFKRYSLPSVLDNTVNNLKNESTLDGDLLMLDTNITLATSVDNTVMGIDQTCLDLTHAYSNNDVACQTNMVNVVASEIALLSDENSNLSEKILTLLEENSNLKEKINNFRYSTTDVQTNPMILPTDHHEIAQCQNCASNKQKEEILEKQIETINQELNLVKIQKVDFEIKYNNLTLEIPTTDALVRKLNILEKEYNSKMNEVTKLTNTLNNKNHELKQLQLENDSLSTQVMENISETDDLNKELDNIKALNSELIEKCSNLERLVQEAEKDNKMNISACPQSSPKEGIIKSSNNIEVHSKLNRSLSDSETSSRYNKICTLQNEIHAGTQDCKELTEDVTTIKNHLEGNNLSIDQNMDLDDSMGESNIFAIRKHFGSVDSQMNKIASPNVKKDRQLDDYTLDKVDCINYYVEKTGADKENLDSNVKIIELMKLFYNQCLTKHSNEVENLVNKLKCYEESRNQIESHVNQMSAEYLEVTKKMEEKENKIKTVTNVLLQIKNQLSMISEEITKCNNVDNKHVNIITVFKENVLKIMDTEFGFTSLNIFESLLDSVINKHHKDLTGIMERYTQLQEHMDSVTAELNTVNENLLKMKCQLSDKENEYNLLKAQKERVHEISNAVTLDIIKKERELCDTITNGCKKLVEGNIMCSNDFDETLPLNKNISLLFERLLNEYKNISPELKDENERLELEVKKSKSDLDEHQKALDTIKVENEKLKDINQSVTLNLVETENKLQLQKSAYDDLTKVYESALKESQTNIAIITNITLELKKLQETLNQKDLLIQRIESEKLQKYDGLSEKQAKISELFDTVANLKQEIDDLKAVNEVITKERDASALELEQCKETLTFNKSELNKMTSDILVLRESVKENSSVIENLKLEAKSLLQQNLDLKVQIEEKCRDCSRLEFNIKTYEKTAEIQSRMIIRIQKQKEDDDKALNEKNKQIEDLTQRNVNLHKDCETLKNNIKSSQEELEKLRNTKESLEMRLAEMELDIDKPRVSIDAGAGSMRRRRQSIHDSKRMFAEDCGDHKNIEAVFDSRQKPEDLFMDVDDDSSNRSTPIRTSKGRDSLLSKHDHSDRESEPSRASSVAATRRRRQSTHDLRRSGVPQTPSPHERSSSRQNELSSWKTSDIDNNNVQSEMSQLRDRLAACHQELEDLKEKYKELDEECETCAQYLRERDDQCLRLKKEKASLETVIAELKEKLHSVNPNRSQQEPKRIFVDASANTDEDWANLHSVVVDRMSYDAEVEKNKRLTKTIDELRFKKQDLKNTISKMQKLIEKKASKDYSRELEVTKLELKACKQELKELKEKYKELDEECETCAEYLRERDEQCRKLKETKAALEIKLQEYEENASKISQSVRKKRQSLHDQNRAPAALLCDVATDTAEDYLSYEVERDDKPCPKEVKNLKMAVEKLSQQKSALEQQLHTISAAPAPNPMYIATGSAIVQNQQITDVMKENQKLKKINAKLVQICKKRGKKSEMESIDISEQS